MKKIEGSPKNLKQLLQNTKYQGTSENGTGNHRAVQQRKEVGADARGAGILRCSDQAGEHQRFLPEQRTDRPYQRTNRDAA